MANKRNSGLPNGPRERLSRTSGDGPRRPRAPEAPHESARSRLSRRVRGDSTRLVRWGALGVMGVLGVVALVVALGLPPGSHKAEPPAATAPAASTPTAPGPAATAMPPPAATPPAPPAAGSAGLPPLLPPPGKPAVAIPPPAPSAAELEAKRLQSVQQELAAEAQRLQALREQTARARQELEEAQRRAARPVPAPVPAPAPAAAPAPAPRPVAPAPIPLAPPAAAPVARAPAPRVLPPPAAAPSAPPGEGASTLESTLQRLRQSAPPAGPSADSPDGLSADTAQDNTPGRSPPPGMLGQLRASPSEAADTAAVPSGRPQVVVHFRAGSPTAEARADAFAQRVVAGGLGDAETRADAAGPSAPLIRYADPADATTAQRLAAMGRANGTAFTVLPGRAGAAGRIEVWVSGD